MNITANGPFVGTLLGQILQGGPAIGSDTLARFYSLHMLVAPGAIFALIGLHLYLVIRLGVSPRRGRRRRPAARARRGGAAAAGARRARLADHPLEAEP